MRGDAMRCRCGRRSGSGLFSRFLLLLLAVSHALVPLALSDAGLVVRRSRLDVLHHAFDGSSGFVSVAVQSTLQENCPAGKYSALEPGHAIAQVIEPHLLSTERFPHPGNGNLALLAFAHWDLDHDSAASFGTPCCATAFRVGSAIILHVAQVISKELAARGARRWALHLTREVRARVDASALAETVGNLASVDAVKSDSDAKAAVPVAVLDENELALLCFGNVGEEILGLIVTGGAASGGRCATSGNRTGTAGMRRATEGIVDRRHCGRTVWRTVGIRAVVGEHLGWSFVRATLGRSLVMMVVVVLLVVTVLTIA